MVKFRGLASELQRAGALAGRRPARPFTVQGATDTKAESVRHGSIVAGWTTVARRPQHRTGCADLSHPAPTWVTKPSRSSGYGWQMRTGGTHRAVWRRIRCCACLSWGGRCLRQSWQMNDALWLLKPRNCAERSRRESSVSADRPPQVRRTSAFDSWLRDFSPDERPLPVKSRA